MYHPSGSLDQKFVKNHCQQQSFFSICGTTTQKMWLQTDKLRIFQSLWLISDIHQFFYQFFRYQASQKFLFYNRYRLFFHGIHKEVSIDEPLNVDWDGNELLLSDILGTDDDVISRRLEDEVEIALLGKAISKLTKREQMIIRLRFGIGNREGMEKTQKEVADLLGISQSYISRLEKRIMKRLRKEIVKYE